MAGEKTAELALELGRLMNEMKYHLRQQILVLLKEHNIDISFELLEVMSFLWVKDGVNQQLLADMAIKDKSSMTYLIDNLVKRNLVRRSADENDGRSKLVFVTPKGRQLQKKLHPWVIEAYKNASSGISPANFRTGMKLVQAMIENVREKNITSL